MPPIHPTEFNRRLDGDIRQECGNRVQLEDGDAALISDANPLPVDATIAGGLADPLPVTLEDAAGAAVGVAASPISVVDTWEIFLVSDEAANDNDKTLTVPAGYEYQILWIWVEYTADGNAGDRQIEVALRDGADDVIGQVRPGVTQAATEARNYMIAPALADLTGFRDTDYLMTPLPPTVFLPAGYDVRIRDNNNVSAGDDMIIQMMVARRLV